jgi:hypothetical protein
MICSPHGMSGLPVHFRSVTVCAWVGLVPDAVANIDAGNIIMPGNMSQPLAFIDFPPKLDWSMRQPNNWASRKIKMPDL